MKRLPTKVIVLCRNANGEAEFYPATPICTENEIALGFHYELAKTLAEKEGFEEPMFPFDMNEVAAGQMRAMAEFAGA